MESMEPFQILVAPVHDIVCTRLRSKDVQCVYIVDFSICYVDKRGNRSSHIDQCVQLYRSLGSAELGPRKQRQAQVDGRRIECIYRLSQIGYARIFGVQFSCLGY